MCAAFAHNLKKHQDVSIECLVIYHSNKADFWWRLLSMDETQVHHFTPETKEQLKQWPHLAKKKVLFHQDNAPVHTSAIAKAKIYDSVVKICQK